LKRAYFRDSRAVSAVLILPGYIGLALVAPELILLVFGQRSGSAAGRSRRCCS
jgi:O-antigen/teichoic acid export membrane protein